MYFSLSLIRLYLKYFLFFSSFYTLFWPVLFNLLICAPVSFSCASFPNGWLNSISFLSLQFLYSHFSLLLLFISFSHDLYSQAIFSYILSGALVSGIKVAWLEKSEFENLEINISEIFFLNLILAKIKFILYFLIIFAKNSSFLIKLVFLYDFKINISSCFLTFIL